MILVRDIFHLKYGMARPFKEAMAEGKKMMEAAAGMSEMRVLADLVGDAYTFVMESTYDNLTAYETAMSNISDPKWGEWYHKTLVPLIESGRREIFTIVE
ncbi:MAG: hypothetical protein HYX66_06370 [Ignavibacteria bacterium]|nr:hypothetical protein [Ignavibacteria bacterium]